MYINISESWLSVHNDLKRFIFSRTRNDADTEDILHDVFLKVHNNIGSLKDRDKLRPWIYQITRNLITDHFRNREQMVFREDPLKSGSASVPSGFMEQAISDMAAMLDELPPGYCEALCLTELQNISIKEYAVRSGISYSGAKSRVRRARSALRDLMMRCCHYEFDKYGTVFEIHPAGCCCCKGGCC